MLRHMAAGYRGRRQGVIPGRTEHCPKKSTNAEGYPDSETDRADDRGGHERETGGDAGRSVEIQGRARQPAPLRTRVKPTIVLVAATEPRGVGRPTAEHWPASSTQIGQPTAKPAARPTSAARIGRPHRPRRPPAQAVRTGSISVSGTATSQPSFALSSGPIAPTSSIAVHTNTITIRAMTGVAKSSQPGRAGRSLVRAIPAILRPVEGLGADGERADPGF